MSAVKNNFDMLDAIRKSSYFDVDWYCSTYLAESQTSLDPIDHYLNEGASAGYDPSRYFSTKGYLRAYPDVLRAGMNPLVHFIKSGHKEGRSPTGEATNKNSLKPPLPRFGSLEYGPVQQWLAYDRPLRHSVPAGLRLCVHIHLFHIEMFDEFASYLANIPIDFTLLVSVCRPSHASMKAQIATRMQKKNCRIIVKCVPNRGRDVAPWVVGFADEIQRHEIFCHLHTKRSDYNQAYAGWRQFLLHNLIGSSAVVEQILDLLVTGDAGVVAPPYFSALPGQPKWGANRAAVECTLTRMGFSIELTECPDYPAGSFFWARVETLKPLLDCDLGYEHFEEEAGQIDGTLGHAIERLIGLMPRLAGGEFIMTSVDVGYNLVNYWDERRLNLTGVSKKTYKCAVRPNRVLLAGGRHRSRVAVMVCSTGGFEEIVPYPFVESEVDYYLITDEIKHVSAIEPPDYFKIVPARYSDPSSRRTARFVKTHPHFYLNGYDFSVWIDANIVPLAGVMPLVKSVEACDADLGLIAHPIRRSWLEEARECIRIGADEAEVLEGQIDAYRSAGLPEEGLIETNIIVADLRRHSVIRFYERWWAEICRYSLRDQVSLNAALIGSGLKISYLFPKGCSVRDAPGFLIFAHGVSGKSRCAVVHDIL